MNRSQLLHQIQHIQAQNFDQTCLEVFHYQYQNNPIYQKFVQLLGKKPDEIREISQIPFLPISLFKTHNLQSEVWEAAAIFKSSGTTGSVQSQHYVRDLDFYLQNAARIFEQFYGQLEEFTILALLPSYLERQDSSLIYMVDYFIKRSASENSGFYLYNVEELASKLEKLAKGKQSVLLLGVTYALLDFAESHPMQLPEHFIMMETGGMKGRRKEMLRSEVHQILKTAFGLKQIHSEYGMTELLSQAYSKGKEIFTPAPTMRMLCRESTDPLSLVPYGRTGGLNIIDLANLDSCSFIATDDLAKVYEDGSFEVLGRFDASDIRGCNLMVEL
jgi:phenylacetate-coenzyme A ligase PaaK-like adenylate-forming protein